MIYGLQNLKPIIEIDSYHDAHLFHVHLTLIRSMATLVTGAVCETLSTMYTDHTIEMMAHIYYSILASCLFICLCLPEQKTYSTIVVRNGEMNLFLKGSFKRLNVYGKFGEILSN
jgi:hypothetical protein